MTPLRKHSAHAAKFVQQLYRPDRATAFIEQGLLAGIRMVAFLVFARIMQTELFGAFALVVAISFVLNNLQRSVVMLPFIISCQNPEGEDQAIREWLWIAIIAAAAAALILLLAWGGALVIGASDWVQAALFFAAISAPLLMFYTFLRRVNYQINNHRNILVMVSVHAAAYAIGIAAAFFIREAQYLPFLAFAAAPAAGGLFGALRVQKYLGIPPTSTFRSFRDSIHFTKWSFLSGVVGSIYNNGMNIIVAGLLGAIGSAMFAATRTIVAPITSLIVATDMIDKPRAGRAFAANGIPGLRRSVRGTLALLVFLGGPYLLLVLIFSGSILEIVYGPKYAGLGHELQIWAIVMLLNMIASPLSTHLITLKDTKSIFRANIVGALVALAVAIPLLGEFGIIAALLGMSSGQLVNLVLLFIATRRDSAETLSLAGAGGEDMASVD